jgi:hypothetical protein
VLASLETRINGQISFCGHTLGDQRLGFFHRERSSLVAIISTVAADGSNGQKDSEQNSHS